ncbi:MAG TPA: hypothetical protein VKA60_19530 [Blastocatellia bacterium]|nr:hypothetical protein [Blastocatellia bacterium]
MSRGSEANAEVLQRKAQHKVKAIRRVVREYNQTLDATNDDRAIPVVRKQQEMDRLVGEYVKLYRAFKRARKKLRKAHDE